MSTLNQTNYLTPSYEFKDSEVEMLKTIQIEIGKKVDLIENHN